jgi:hypothetical protein
VLAAVREYVSVKGQLTLLARQEGLEEGGTVTKHLHKEVCV